MKTSTFAWREHHASTLREHLEYQPCLADNDVWIHPTTKTNGHKYYEMVFVYTDDILVISHKPKETLTMLDHHNHLKPDSIGVPTTYLGSQVMQFNLNDDPAQRCWALSAEKYVSEAIRNVKCYLEQQGQVLKSKASGVLPSVYHPELDLKPYCDDEAANYYQQQIGVLQWIVELGRVDVCTEVSMLASYAMAPREGHMQAIFHMFTFLNTHQRSTLVLDPSYIDHRVEDAPDW